MSAKKRLDELGFVWDPLDVDWENAFAVLVKFKEREGHCHVPKSHGEGDYNLGRWVSFQRTLFDTMYPDRRKRLDELGFIWDAASWKRNSPC